MSTLDVTTMNDPLPISVEAPWQEFSAAWVDALAEMPPIPKDQTANAGSYSYKYAGFPTIRDTVVPILAKHGLAHAQDVTTRDGKIAVTTRIYHKSGHVEHFGPLELPAGSNAQSAGSAITYARRYALQSALGLATEDDDDGARASRQPEPQPERTDPELSPSGWMATAVEMFGQWNPDQRRDIYLASIKELEVTNPLTSMEDAKRVLEHMAKAYHRQYPDNAPF